MKLWKVAACAFLATAVIARPMTTHMKKTMNHDAKVAKAADDHQNSLDKAVAKEVATVVKQNAGKAKDTDRKAEIFARKAVAKAKNEQSADLAAKQQEKRDRKHDEHMAKKMETQTLQADKKVAAGEKKAERFDGPKAQKEMYARAKQDAHDAKEAEKKAYSKTKQGLD